MERKSRKERLRENARREIVEAAAKVFAKHGFYKATMEQIAGEAGFSAASLYHYFKSKEDIYITLHEQIGSAFLNIVEEIGQADLPFRAKIERLARRLFELAESQRDFFLLFISQRPLLDRSIQDELFEKAFNHYDQIFNAMKSIIEEGTRKEETIRIPLEDITAFYVGVLRSFFSEWIRMGGKSSLIDKASVVSNLFFRGAGQ